MRFPGCSYGRHYIRGTPVAHNTLQKACNNTHALGKIEESNQWKEQAVSCFLNAINPVSPNAIYDRLKHIACNIVITY